MKAITRQDLIDYLKKSPENLNFNIFNKMLEDYKETYETDEEVIEKIRHIIIDIIEKEESIKPEDDTITELVELITRTLPKVIKDKIAPYKNGLSGIIEKNQNYDLVIPEGVTEIGSYTVYQDNKLRSVVIPDSVRTIRANAFENCSNLQSITGGNNIQTIERFAFKDSKTQIGFSGDCRWYLDRNGNFSIKGTTMRDYDESNIGKPDWSKNRVYRINVEEGVQNIGSNAFSNCTNLTSIDLPDSLTSIGERAFSYCSNLTSIELPDSLTNIEAHAFYNCGLTSIDLPDSLTSIKNSTFSNCRNLTSIDLPNDLTNIGNNAFYGCTNLTSIDLPDGLTNIEYSAFSYCSNLTSIELPDSLTNIGTNTFEYCRNLTSIYIGSGITHIDSCFGPYVPLTNITGGENLLYFYDDISNTPFYTNQPDGPIYIGSTYYTYKGNLPENSSITIKENTKGISSFINQNSSRQNLISVNLPDSLVYIGNDAFSGCTNLTSIELPNGLTSIGSYAFHNCNSLTSIELPNGLTSIGSYAFGDCLQLTDVYYAGTEEDWNNISIGSGNNYLLNATIHYNHTTSN